MEYKVPLVPLERLACLVRQVTKDRMVSLEHQDRAGQ